MMKGPKTGLRYLLERPGHVVPGDFEPGPEILDFMQHDSRCGVGIIVILIFRH